MDETYFGPDVNPSTGEFVSSASSEEPPNPSIYTPVGKRPSNYEEQLRAKYAADPALLESALNAEKGAESFVETRDVSTFEATTGINPNDLIPGNVSKDVGDSLKTAAFYVVAVLVLILAIEVAK